MSETLLLYSYWRSSSAYRVRIALNLKGIPHRIEPVHLLRNEQRREEYRRLNPSGLVPCLADGDFALGQSLAIFNYLEAHTPEPSLVPVDPRAAARMWALCAIIACDTQPLQNLSVFQHLETNCGLDQNAREDWARHWIARGLGAFEASLGEGPYCVGAPSFADCVLIPQLYNAGRYGLDPSQWPRLAAAAEAFEDLPEVAAAHPDRQPDTPSDS